MEAISILSNENVKPSTLPAEPMIKLSLLDQLTPMSYSPLILFYHPSINTAPIPLGSAQRLKWSLSQALSIYYPLAGRVRDNFSIHDFHVGVPFLETRVNCRLRSLFGGGSHNVDQMSMMGKLNNLLPFLAFCKAHESGPLLAVQMNVFECGGMALGCCFSHKTTDAATASAFLKAWSTVNAGGQLLADVEGKVVGPSFSEGPLTFPPMSRAEAVSAFIWKLLVSASGCCRPSLFSQTVDLRRLTWPRLSRNSFGNFVLFSDSSYDPSKSHDMETRVDVLVGLIRDGVNDLKDEYAKWMSSTDDRTVLEAIFDSIDFGWGPTIWVGLGGATTGSKEVNESSSWCYSNLVVLTENRRSKGGIEAWLTLEEPMMTALEQDPEFSEFASSEFAILSTQLSLCARL
ncbi:Stemmadenine O-acetyltransferase [Linum perenne]